jgi:hypothetical protein
MTNYPEHQRWRFLHQHPTDAQLVEFSQSICASDDRKVDDCLPELLAFLNLRPQSFDHLKEAWLKIWVNMMHQMGLGYTSGPTQGNIFLHATGLGTFLASTGDVDSYYYFWALRFQYPFAYPKHNHYITEGVAVQPVVLILTYLSRLYDTTGRIDDAFLTRREIVNFLMKSANHSQQTIDHNIGLVLQNRSRRYDYSMEARTAGFDEAGNELFSRGRRLIERVNLLSFVGDSVKVAQASYLARIKAFLTYAKPPIQFARNHRDSKSAFFLDAFCDLNPMPDVLRRDVRNSKSLSMRHRARRPKLVHNAASLEGGFIPRAGYARDFQGPFRDDLLEEYSYQCAICGIDIEDFLIASHIVPVKVDRSISNDRRNGLMLCRIHDAALENGYIGISDSMQVVVNPSIVQSLRHPTLRAMIVDINGQSVRLPRDAGLSPLTSYLQRHRRLHNISDSP